MSVRRAAVTTLAALLAALSAASCAAGQSAAPAVGVPMTTSTAVALPQGEVGQTHRVALALIAFGELGREKGSTQALRSLASRTAGDGRSLDGQIRELATVGGLVLGDEVDAAVQGVLTDLRAREGREFDQAWLPAVGTVVGQGREAADAIRTAPGAPREAVSVAGNILARLTALANALGHAIARGSDPTR